MNAYPSFKLGFGFSITWRFTPGQGQGQGQGQGHGQGQHFSNLKLNFLKNVGK